MSEQILRQAKNEVTLVGVVQESTLEQKTFNKKDGSGTYEAISGNITLKTGEDETQVVSYFAKQLTLDGKENQNFKALNTVMKDLVTLADIAQGLTEGEATRLECKGELGLNEYRGQDGEIKSFPRINGRYSPRRFKDGKFVPKAEFDIEGIVKSVKPELYKGEETGRLKINLYVPLYGGKIVPLQFVTNEGIKESDIDYLHDHFLPGASVNLNGKLVNKSKEITRTIEMGFGDNKVETTYERTREFVVTGGIVYEEGSENEKKIFDVSLLKEALANRERHLATLRERDTSKKEEKKLGFGSNSTPNTKKPEENIEDNFDNLFGED